MNTYTVEIRKTDPTVDGDELITITIRCKYTSLIGTVYEKYPGYGIVRYY